MTMCYVKYLDLNCIGDCNKIIFFSGYMDAYEFRNEILKLKEVQSDIYYDGEVGMFEYFNRKELIEELNKIGSTVDTFSGHIK